MTTSIFPEPTSTNFTSNFNNVSSFTSNNSHILVWEWNLSMNLFIEITFYFDFSFVVIESKYFFSVYVFFFLSHWSMWRVECKFFTLVSLRIREFEPTLKKKKWVSLFVDEPRQKNELQVIFFASCS